MLIRILLLIIIAFLPHSSMAADKLDNAARWYKIFWNNVYIADFKVEISNDNIDVKIDSKGLAKSISKYKNYLHSNFYMKGTDYIPISFDSALTQRQGTKNVKIQYAKTGEIINDTVTPPDNRTKRPAVSADLKKDAVDPLFAAITARKKIRECLKNDTKEFNFNIYDGRRLSKLEFNLYGLETIKIKDRTLKILKISFRRIAIKGFTKNELKRMQGEEPDFILYLEEDTLFPVKVDANAPLGKAIFVMVQ